MCGIAGIILPDQQKVSESDLRKMADTLQHRGPDGEGFYRHENVGFAHRRLAIIDLSEAGAQPMAGFGCSITYNGEIYNYVELRQQLEKQGLHFETSTDTEVILAAYHFWGADCVKQFNGMWAFALHDPARKQVFFSRDRFGEKPFYFFQSSGSLYFASEIRALQAVAASPFEVNDIMAARFLVYEQAEHFSETFFKGIHKLPAAHNMIMDLHHGNCQVFQYYHPTQISSYHSITENEAVEVFRNLLMQSVKFRLRSDVEVGTCLSGGLDSSAIAAFASKQYNKEQQHSFTGITAGSQDNQKDETTFAKQVASFLGMNWKHCKPTIQDYQSAFTRVLSIQEEPFDSSSVLMQHFVMQLAKQEGLKVLLDGQGADELLMGYKPHLAWAIRQLPLGQGIALGAKSLKRYRIGMKELLLLMAYHTNTQQKRNRQLSSWEELPPELKDQLKEEAVKEASLPKDVFSRQCYELTHRILPMLLRYEDKNAMAFSIETRLPFLDPNIVEFALSLPLNMKIQDGWSKYVLRKSVEDVLPDEIVWRKGKVGFEAPGITAQVLLSRTDTDSMQGNITSRLSNAINKSQLNPAKQWRLYSLGEWEKRCI